MPLGDTNIEGAVDGQGRSRKNIEAVFVHNIEGAEAVVRRRIKTAHILKMDEMSSRSRSTFHQAEMVLSKQIELRT